MKPRLFIGSSTENLEVARAIEDQLRNDADCNVWDQDIFNLSSATLTDLLTALDSADFGVFVLAGDDKVWSRGQDLVSPRDNVVFELGLFMGRLGPNRTFIVRPQRVTNLKWLSDLAGISAALYDHDRIDKEPQAAVGPACNQIRRHINKHLPQPGFYVGSVFESLGRGWWGYGSPAVSIEALPEYLQLIGSPEGGIQYPYEDNLSIKASLCVMRLRLTASNTDARTYVVVGLQSGQRVKLHITTLVRPAGWGDPKNEFLVPIPRLSSSSWKTLALDLASFSKVLGSPIRVVEGFRIKPPIQLSHIFLASDVNEIPTSVRRDWIEVVAPEVVAPTLDIVEPKSGGEVGFRHVVRGTIKPHGPVQVLVYPGDRRWYSQQTVTVTGETWTVECQFGNKDAPPGGTYRIVAISAADRIQSHVPDLPEGVPKSEIVTVARTS
jgi:Predicted nucleotide-binding protein containing TIR-like domain